MIDREAVQARAESMSSIALGVALEEVIEAFFGPNATPLEIAELLMHRGLSVAAAGAVASLHVRLTT